MKRYTHYPHGMEETDDGDYVMVRIKTTDDGRYALVDEGGVVLCTTPCEDLAEELAFDMNGEE